MKLKDQEGDISLIGRDCGKTPNGIFPEIQESFTDLAAGGVRKHCSEETKKKISASVRLTLERKKKRKLYRKKYYQKNRGKILACTKKHHKDNREYYSNYYRKRRLDRIDAIFETFGYSVEVLDRMGAALD